MTKRFAMGVALLLAVLSVGTPSAHHSYSSFDHERVVSIEGTLDKIDFLNPHVLLRIKTAEVIYLAERGSVSQLTRNGVAKDALKAGDRLVVRGAPKRDPNDHTLALLQEVRRPADGWSWRSLPNSAN